ncbi:MAG TPA: type II secretion system protein [Candidatus Onthousia excrementipullorum]|uniref:Type II secretion system protein n=1 Tax=Candidatus Onthousia excrementipullorum TaxID=2840884 RepID=A0A9D1DV18_9FIRM|nr:type II secretion system protein [Candidatus Onthousia excrementipullorum]
MNKKGFTLIELLATISILALLMMVAVPNVMSTIDKNKQNTYVEDAKRMITLAEYEIRSNSSIELPTSGNCIVIPLGSLDLTDFSDGPEGGSYDLENSYVVIARSGSSYVYYATIVENYDGSTRGLPLISRDDLNKESARTKVVKGDDLNIIIPKVGSKLNGYTVSNIIDS